MCAMCYEWHQLLGNGKCSVWRLRVAWGQISPIKIWDVCSYRKGRKSRKHWNQYDRCIFLFPDNFTWHRIKSTFCTQDSKGTIGVMPELKNLIYFLFVRKFIISYDENCFNHFTIYCFTVFNVLNLQKIYIYCWNGKSLTLIQLGDCKKLWWIVIRKKWSWIH